MTPLLAVLLLVGATTAPVLEVHRVLLPEDSRLVQQSVNRVLPEVEVVSYEGQTQVSLGPHDVLVHYLRDESKIPDQYRKVTAMAVAHYERRRVYVFIPTVEAVLRMDDGDPRFRVALGRILAHELEHVRRQSAEHDASGYFRACLTRDQLLDPR